MPSASIDSTKILRGPWRAAVAARRAKSAASSAETVAGRMPGRGRAERRPVREGAKTTAAQRATRPVTRASALRRRRSRSPWSSVVRRSSSVIGTLPIRSSSPSRSATGAVSRWPLTKVPFLEPRSSSVASPAATMTRAWRRDTPCASIQTRESEPRPRTFSPSARAISRWPQSRRKIGSPSTGRAAVPARRRRRPGERVAVSVDRADELRRAGVVAGGRADLRDERRKVDVGDHGVGPEALVQLGLRDRARARLEQDLEQLEGLGRDGDGPVPRATGPDSRNRG